MSVLTIPETHIVPVYFGLDRNQASLTESIVNGGGAIFGGDFVPREDIVVNRIGSLETVAYNVWGWVYDAETSAVLGGGAAVAQFTPDLNLPLKAGKRYIWKVVIKNNSGATQGFHGPMKRTFFVDNENFRSFPPSFIQSFGPQRAEIHGGGTPPAWLTDPTYIPTYSTGVYAHNFYGLVAFEFKRSVIIEQSTPPEIVIYKNINQFNLTLPESWRVKDILEWEIQYAVAADNATWPEWTTLVNLPASQISYAHTNLDPAKYYRYRYQVRKRGYASNWSELASVGKPNTVEPSQTTGTGSVGEAELQDDAVTAAKIADGVVAPNHINQTAGTFTFPNEISGASIRARTGGVVFPDASIQMSAGVPLGHTHAQADITNLVTDLAAKSPLASPAFTGTPTTTTPTGTPTTQIANVNFVTSSIDDLRVFNQTWQGTQTLQGSTATAIKFRTLNTGDANPKYSLQLDGKMGWGPGGGSVQDTFLERISVGTLKTAARLQVGTPTDPEDATTKAYVDSNSGSSQAVVAKAVRTTTQTITNGQWVKVLFNSTDFDTDLMFNAAQSRVVVNTAGYYTASGHGRWTGTAQSNTRWVDLRLYTSGGALKETRIDSRIAALGGGTQQSAIYTPVYCAVGDYFELWVYNDNSQNIDVDTTIEVHLVGATVGQAPEPIHVVGTAGEPGFKNSWRNGQTGFSNNIVSGDYGPLRFWKTIDNMVFVQGMINSAAPATAVGVFDLPSGYRPDSILSGPLPYWSGSNIMGRWYIQDNSGEFRCYNNADVFGNSAYWYVNASWRATK